MAKRKLTADILKLYVSSEMFVPEDNRSGILTGMDIHTEPDCVILAVSYGSTDDYNVFNENNHDIDRVNPILRRINNITEEERTELWNLVFRVGQSDGMGGPFKGNTRFIDETSHYSRPRWVLQQGIERLGIEVDGHVWADCDLFMWRHNQHDVTRWLLSKSFDLFNLIDNKLANEKV